MKSEGFCRGYNAAVELYGMLDESRRQDFSPENPFPIGSEEEEGFEEAVYDLTHK